VFDGVVYNLVDRFGAPPASVENLICECRLRLLSSAVGIKEICGGGCGVVCSFVFMDSVALTESYLNYIEIFFGRRNISFHFLPKKDGCLSFCVHFSDDADKYSILSKFLNKFKALK
jgi:transcription-repair coupling factor (superfamily II helicase)